jgi:hypothetical protein
MVRCGGDVQAYVAKLREQNPGLSDDELAWRIVTRKAFKNGLVGFFTSLPGLPALPVTVPTDVVASWQIQVTTVLAVATVYGHTPETTDLRTDIYLVLAGDAAVQALKQFGVKASRILTQRAVSKYVTREMMQQIWRVLGRKIITKAGEKSLTSFTKMVPVVGGVVGYMCDWAATRTIGLQAIRYYGGSPPERREPKRAKAVLIEPRHKSLPARRGRGAVHLVSCVSRKRSGRHPAEDLYDSAWFRKARGYVEGVGGPWFVLSAKHGLVRPDETIEPYDETLSRMSALERRRWAATVMEELADHLNQGDRVVLLAGAKYRQHLVGPLQELGAKVDVPMEGLGIGEQLQWLDRHTRKRR